MALPQTVNERRATVGLERFWPVGLTLIIGTAVSVVGYLWVAQLGADVSVSNFRAEAVERVSIIERRLGEYPDSLGVLGTHFETQTGQTSREHFALHGGRLMARSPGLGALLWIPLVAQDDRLAREDAMRGSGTPGAQFWERGEDGKKVRAPPRPLYYPIVYAIARKGESPDIGFDLGSNPKCRAQLDALHADTPVVLRCPGLAPLPGMTDSSAVVLVMPVVREAGESGATGSDRHDHKVRRAGFIMGVFHPKAMIQDAFAGLSSSGVAMYFFEQGARGTSRLVYASQPAGGEAVKSPVTIASLSAGTSYETTLAIANLKLWVVCVPSLPFSATDGAWNAVGVLGAGLLFTFLAMLYHLMSGRRLREVENVAAEMRLGIRELKRRDEIQAAIAVSASELLRTTDFNHSVVNALARIGSVAGADRVYIFQVRNDDAGHVLVTRRFTWTTEEFKVAPGSLIFVDEDMEALGLSSWIPRLRGGELVTGLARNFEEPVQALLLRTRARAILVIPLFVSEKWWGQIALDNCSTEREWTTSEIDAVKTVAELFGSALRQQEIVSALSDANRIVENSSTIMFRLGADRTYPLLFLSHNVARYGYAADELLASPAKWQSLVVPEDIPQLVEAIEDVLTGKKVRSYQEFRIQRPDGTYVWLDGQLAAVRDERGNLVAMEGVASDITERKRAEDQMESMARTDLLTNLPNRTAFLERIGTEFDQAKRTGSRFAVLYFDMDYFKDVNDALGHAVGDMLLRAVSGRLLANVRSGDLVARLGGDEFAVLRTDIQEPANAGALATKLLEACAEPYKIAGKDVHITVSIGITLYDEMASGPDDLLTRADLALYRAKSAGRNRFAFHSEEMDEAVRERVWLADDLRAALAAGNQLTVVYQPQVEILSGRVVGIEALVRWDHPTRGPLAPDAFISAAEASGLIRPLGLWVLRESCWQMRRWLDAKIAPPVMAVNLSVVQLMLDHDFAEIVGKIISETGLGRGDLELELTESTLMETTRDHRAVLMKLRDKGARLSIDDFGTGYSSLDYLRSYSVNRIKIAQKFVDGVPGDAGDAAIVRATLGLAQAFGIEVIAEGVECAAQAEFLTSIGCRFAQGYFFSRPLVRDDAGAYLAEAAQKRQPAVL